MANGLDCIYTLLSHVSYLIKKTSKVFVGASALLSNGSLVSRIGSALVSFYVFYVFKINIFNLYYLFFIFEFFYIVINQIFFNENAFKFKIWINLFKHS